MRRYLRSFGSQTPGEKQGMLDGTNLFFGALLGANLGTVENLPLADYAVLIILLVGTVVALRQFSTSERRGYAWSLLGAYIVLVAILLFDTDGPVDALAPDDRNRLGITLMVWAGTVVLAELFPTRPALGQDQAG